MIMKNIKNKFKIYENIKDFLDLNNENLIIFCVASNGIVDMVKNLIISAKNCNINIILFALDKYIVKNMTNMCDIVKYYNDTKCRKVNSKKQILFETKEFKNVIFQRYFIGNEMLKRNKTYIYLDSDIVIEKNFVDDILNIFKTKSKVECIMQTHYGKNSCCAGIIIMKPCNNTLALDFDFFKKYKYEEYMNDELFFTSNVIVPKKINMHYLNNDLYPIGHHYYRYKEKIENKTYLIHFNFAIGEEKIIKMKKYNKWFVNKI